MPEYLDDPSVLTKDKLKSELLAQNVELPSGNPTKDVYVQLYLKNLTAQNKKHATATTLDAFSSDEELPPPVVASRSRSSGRKATRKTDRVRPEELDVTLLTDEGLRDELFKHGVDVGPIVASTRKLYEKKLQKLLDDGPAQPPLPQLVLTEIQVNHNGNSESELYSDKEDEVTTAPEPEPVAEPEPEPEPAPLVERPVRSRGKTPVTPRTRSSQHHTREQLMDEENDDDEPVLRVKHRSRRLSHRRSLAGETVSHNVGHKPTLDPAMKMVAQNTAEVCRAPGSPRWKIHKEELGLDLPKHSKDSSHKAVALLNTALLESKSLPEEQSPRPASRPSSPLVLHTRVDPVSFSPMCNISPIKSQEPHWTVSDQIGSKPSGVSAAGEECDPPDILLHKRRQQKITDSLSTCSPAKTHSYTSRQSGDAFVRQVEKITASDQNPKVEEKGVLKELFPNDINSPTGIIATCRRPIRGAAGRPVKSSDLWNSENSLFSPKTTKTSSSSCSYTETRTVNRVTSLPPSSPSATFNSSIPTSSFSTSSSSSSRLLSAAPPAGQTKAVRRSMSLWIKLFLLAIVAAFLFLVYQAMETNTLNPFVAADTEVAGGSTA
ncbi:thymopoietin a isoform X4 [Xiphias gladius]|uniref:thymopoietin a isoform X4 n=1 Tax=Xiphias gladius TaxID=8245 RepID=UPI001A981E13|nr:thymopoietin a isoform X4 [Xiphias gladius]